MIDFLTSTVYQRQLHFYYAMGNSAAKGARAERLLPQFQLGRTTFDHHCSEFRTSRQ